VNPQPPTTASRPPLVILGASCRFAAESASRAGWGVHAADLFDDRDLAAAAVASHRVAGYPDGLVAAAASFPPGPWCYTGAIENHRQVIECVSAVRPLAGNAVAEVCRVRDPAAVAALARLAGLRFPDTFATPHELPTDGSFLRKPLASAGGRSITPWLATPPPNGPGFIWQRRVAGDPVAAVFCLADVDSRLLGASRQLVGTDWCRAAPFAYAGSVSVPRAGAFLPIHDQLESLATVLSSHAGLRGVVGVDAIVERDGCVSVIEINPRPTASAELVERSMGGSILEQHLAAFGLRSPVSPPSARPDDTVWSKAILFAAHPLPLDGHLIERVRGLAAPWSDADGHGAIADIPRAGQVLRAGAPVLTVFGRGESPAASTAELRRRIEALQAITG
jgi:predicted ATP-grasp superfamily ATP-dependent carboligase